MRVRFQADFDWSPPAHGGRVTTAYRAGDECTVTHDCAAAAIAAGKAIEIAPPRKRR
jgi:hypothetical protein